MEGRQQGDRHDRPARQGVISVGFYGSLFFRTWLVEARALEPGRAQAADHRLIVLAATQEEAVDKARRYLTAEGFQVGQVQARFG